MENAHTEPKGERKPSRTRAWLSSASDQPGLAPFLGPLKKSLLLFFLASGTEARPRHSFQAFVLQFLFTMHTTTVSLSLDAAKRIINLVQGSAVGAVQAEQEL